MLERLDLLNFQSHHKLSIAFDETHVTTIVGPTDVGKTAIIRSLWWLLFNDPSGLTGIRTWDEETVQVIGWFDGHKIIRKRSDSQNIYKIDKKVYKAFGRSVPGAITHVTNVRPESFQHQLDGPFWISLTAGQAAQALNEIVDLSVIDRSLRSVQSQVRDLKSKCDVTKGRLKEARKRKKDLLYVKRLDRDTHALEKMDERVRKEGEEITALSETLNALWQATDRQKRTKAALEYGREVKRTLKGIRRAEDDCESLSNLIDRIGSKRDAIENSRKEVRAIEQRLHRLTKGRCPVCGRRYQRSRE